MMEKVIKGLSLVYQSVSTSYDAIDPGEYSVKGYLLYKGDYNIIAHEDIIDSYMWARILTLLSFTEM